MENKLKALFDYQKFDPSPRLEKLIRNTESQGRRKLSDDEVEMVSAAGAWPTNDLTNKYMLNFDQKLD